MAIICSIKILIIIIARLGKLLPLSAPCRVHPICPFQPFRNEENSHSKSNTCPTQTAFRNLGRDVEACDICAIVSVHLSSRHGGRACMVCSLVKTNRYSMEFTERLNVVEFTYSVWPQHVQEGLHDWHQVSTRRHIAYLSYARVSSFCVSFLMAKQQHPASLK